MKHTINIRGSIIPNSYKDYYDYFGEDSTCPNDVKKVLDNFVAGDEIEVYINSPGGVIDVGSEIYTLLRSKKDFVKIYITGEACSSASIIAMASYCEMSPTALLMVHCVSTVAGGNHKDMEKVSEILKTADKALCTAYMEKAGISEKEALELMENETWLTAQQALDKGLIDKIMFKEDTTLIMTNSNFSLPNEEQLNKVRQLIINDDKNLLQAKLEMLKLKGNK